MLTAIIFTSESTRFTNAEKEKNLFSFIVNWHFEQN